ncbi:ankyrin repeat-containing domain protein [Fimicolochytrium jonesii]|uniref:ankyrin repeat-containing domain protein n=1 Tax=Fimicolochytrium jonesii TaxID=1396493 RepID=UPI0022FF3F91|nr:ankyrin repeat-containing domain protein [Fimicolochytrium jonesii]KAI8824809.1 ankyrin repeat-containing domain protein [Fimicolochytrium jonesii]
MSTPNNLGQCPLFSAVQTGVEKQHEGRNAVLNNLRQYSWSERDFERNVDYTWDRLLTVLEDIKDTGAQIPDPPVQVPKDHKAGDVAPEVTGKTAVYLAAKSLQPVLLGDLAHLGCAVDHASSSIPTALLEAFSPDPASSQDPSTAGISDHHKVTFDPAAQRWRETLSILLEYEANPAIVCEKEKTTALLELAKRPLDCLTQTPVVEDASAAPVVRPLTVLDFIMRCSGDGINYARKEDGMTALMHFVLAKNGAAVKALVDRGADVNAENLAGETVLGMAAKSGAVSVLTPLVESGRVNLSHQDKNGDTALMHTVRLREPSAALCLLDACADKADLAVAATNKEGWTALHLACRAGVVRVVEALLEAGGDRNAVGPNGTFALIEAVKGDHLSCVVLLLDGDRPAKADVSDDLGTWALHYAVQAKSWKMVKMLLDAGASVTRVNKNLQTPLHLAIQQSKSAINTSLKIERLLIEKGASTNAQDCQGRTPLHIAFVDVDRIPFMQYTRDQKKKHDAYRAAQAARQEDTERRKQIVKQYAFGDVEADMWIAAPALEVYRLEKLKEKSQGDAMDADDRDPGKEWYTGVWEGDQTSAANKSDPIEIVSYLLGVEGIKLDTVDKFGRTPLHYAASVGAFTSSSYLLERGALLDSEDLDTNTPLQIALLYEHIDYAVMLANKDAQVLRHMTIPNRSGHTADKGTLSTFKYSLRKGYMALAYLIMAKGQDLLQAVHDAVSTGRYHIAVLLLSETPAAKLREMRNGKGQTVFHVCFDFAPLQATVADWDEYGRELVDMFLDMKLDWTTKDLEGRTALHYAAANGHTTLVAKLLESGAADVAAVLDTHGRSALGYALENRHQSTVELLLKACTRITEDDKSTKPSLMNLAIGLRSKDILKVSLRRSRRTCTSLEGTSC